MTPVPASADRAALVRRAFAALTLASVGVDAASADGSFLPQAGERVTYSTARTLRDAGELMEALGAPVAGAAVVVVSACLVPPAIGPYVDVESLRQTAAFGFASGATAAMTGCVVAALAARACRRHTLRALERLDCVGHVRIDDLSSALGCSADEAHDAVLDLAVARPDLVTIDAESGSVDVRSTRI